ncbi:MAG: hypothetical protein HY770_01080 [Chitinivibrionia bacterium]|nr:hypothetical protein [Chitinivibrionia bacterium]
MSLHGAANWKVRLKPAAPVRTHLLLAACAWSIVGSVLVVLGFYWVHAAGSTSSYLVLAIAIGYAKSRFVLDNAARRAAARIVERGDGKCAGGFFSYKSWLLVAAMALAGRFLRSGLVSQLLLGFIYVAVGSALLISSRLFWRSYTERAKNGAQ